MTNPESGAVGYADGEVREDGQQPVVNWLPEGQVVGDLMDSKEQVLVGSCTDEVRGQQELPAED